MFSRISRISFMVCVLLVLTAPVWAFDLGQNPPVEKNDSHLGQNPGQPDGRQGGETISTALLIEGLPFYDTGNTSDNIDDYDEVCPYGDSLSPDVVYSFTPFEDITLVVDLCGSGYDTKTYIYDVNQEVVACNDDFYFTDECGGYVSKIEDAPLVGGQTYFIVVDGYNGDSGDYILSVDVGMDIHSCILDCYGMAEGEPELQDYYDDEFNPGCFPSGGAALFQTLSGDDSGGLVFCGISGWYVADGNDLRGDTDWFTARIGSSGILEWTLDSEQDVFGFLLGPQDCSQVGVLEIMQSYCSAETMIIQGSPGETVWLWVGPVEFSPSGGFEGHEFTYICVFDGLAAEGTIATQQHSFDSLKSLYR